MSVRRMRIAIRIRQKKYRDIEVTLLSGMVEAGFEGHRQVMPPHRVLGTIRECLYSSEKQLYKEGMSFKDNLELHSCYREMRVRGYDTNQRNPTKNDYLMGLSQLVCLNCMIVCIQISSTCP